MSYLHFGTLEDGVRYEGTVAPVSISWKDVHAFLYAFPFLSWCCLKVSSVKNQEIKCKKMVHTMSANFTNRRISRALLGIFYHINSLTANVVQAGMKNSHPVGFLR